jgi:hypothetical protein
MKIYRVEMCLTLVISRLKKFRLNEYNSENPILFIQANDPDDACNKAICNLATIIFKQDNSIETIKFVRDLFYDIRIEKVYVPE